MGACFILALIPLSMVCTVSPHVAQAQSVASCCLRVSCVSLLARMVSNGLVRFAFNVLVELAAASFASPLFSARVNFLPSASFCSGRHRAQCLSRQWKAPSFFADSPGLALRRWT